MYRRERRPRRSDRRKAVGRYDMRTNLPIEVKFVRRNAGDGVPYGTFKEVNYYENCFNCHQR